MSKTSHALTLVADPKFAVAKDDLAKLKESAVLQVSAISELESKAALGALLAGLTLHRVKASLPHGQFGQWLAQISTSGGNLTVKKSQAHNYMRLALVFLERAKVQKPDLLALPGDQLALEVGDGHPARSFFTKAAKFVGDLSLNELLIKHGIKGVGLKSALLADGEDDESLSPEEKLVRSRERAWQETFESVQRIRASLTEPARAQLLSDPGQIKTLKAEVVELNKLLDDRLADLSATKV